MRIGKVFLSKNFISKIQGSDIELIIVSQNNLDLSFFMQFTFAKVSLVKTIEKESISFWGRIYGLSELLRTCGYWYKFRNKGLWYYYHNMFRQFSAEFPDKRFPFYKRTYLFFISFFGQFSFLWKFFDSLLSFYFKIPEEIKKCKSNTEKVCLVQAACWGYQDRMLSFWAKKNNINSFLIPYTSDQLTMNGYLINDFKKVFVQGPIEFEYAKNIHNVDYNRILQAGSLWLRNIDATKNEPPKKSNNKIRILYAGISDLYYPRIKELQIIKELVLFLDSHFNNRFEFIYRPYISNKKEIEVISSFFNKIDCFNIHFPDQLINSLSTSDDIIDVKQFSHIDISSISDFDILIMSLSTSLAIDIAYVSKCLIISNLVDTEEGFLAQRGTEKGLIMNNTLRFGPGCKLIRSSDELCKIVSFVFKNEIDKSNSSIELVNNWDYNNKFYEKANLLKYFFNNTN